MISDRLLSLLCCPTCGEAKLELRQPATASHGSVEPAGALVDQQKPLSARLECPLCHSSYTLSGEYAEVMPSQKGWAASKYSSGEFEDELDYRDVSEPLLAAGVRQRQLERMLPLGLLDSMIDLGCGNGKFSVWNQGRCGYVVGVDSTSLFASQAIQRVDLVKGDARRLPFPGESFTRAISIDVLEHFSAEDVALYLAEAWRVLRPGGLLFVYSNTRERGRYRWVIDLERAISERLAGAGLIDLKADLLRKSDHVKAIATLEDLKKVTSEAGFRLREIVFWNGILQGLVENIIVKSIEGLAQRLRRRQSSDALSDVAQTSRGRQSLRRSVGQRRGAILILKLLTAIMDLDIRLWGRSRTGPFFAVLEKPFEGPA